MNISSGTLRLSRVGGTTRSVSRLLVGVQVVGVSRAAYQLHLRAGERWPQLADVSQGHPPRRFAYITGVLAGGESYDYAGCVTGAQSSTSVASSRGASSSREHPPGARCPKPPALGPIRPSAKRSQHPAWAWSGLVHRSPPVGSGRRPALEFAGTPHGYAFAMSDQQKPQHESQPQPGTKPGPANPAAEGVEAPTPPEGPLREDRAEGGLAGGHDDEVSGSRTANRSATESGGHTIAREDEQPSGAAGPREEQVQEENAETSLDQPSGTGSEG